MNFKTPFKVLTTAALIGTLSLSAVAPGAASAAEKTTQVSQKEAEQNFSLDKVVLTKGDSKITISFTEYVLYAGSDKLNGYELAFVTAGNGEIFSKTDYALYFQTGDAPADVIERLSGADKAQAVEGIEEGTFDTEDGKLGPVTGDQAVEAAKAALVKEVEAAKATEIKDAAAKAELTKAIAAAEKVAAKEDATKEELEAAKAELTKAVAAAKKADAEAALEAKVESVTAINATQVEVKFNKELDKTTAEDATKYKVDGSALADGTTAAQTPKQAKVKLQDDKKSVIITLADAQVASPTAVKAITFQVDGVKTADEKTIKHDVETITFKDVVAPEVTKVEYDGTDVTYTFSEPLSLSNAGVVSRVNGTPTVAPTISGNTVTVAATIAADTTADLYLTGIKDTAGNEIAPYTGTVKYEADTVAPKVESAEQIAQDTIRVVLSEKAKVDLTNASFKILKGSTVYTATDAFASVTKNTTVDPSGKTYDLKLNTTNISYGTASSQSITLIVDEKAFKDAAGNDNEEFSKALKLETDTTAAKLVSSKLKSDGSAFELTYDEELATGTPTAVVTDENGVRHAATVATTAGSKVAVVTLTASNPAAGTYTIKLTGVKDAYGNETATHTATVTVEETADTTKPTLTIANVEDSGTVANEFTITSTEELTADALKPENFTLDGKALPEGTDIYFADDTKKVIVIELPANSINIGVVGTGTAAVLKATNLKAKNGTVAEDKTANVTIEDNTSAKLVSAKLATEDTILLTFDEDVDPTTAAAIDESTLADDFEIKVGTAILNLGTDDSTATGGSAAEVTVSTVASNAKQLKIVLKPVVIGTGDTVAGDSVASNWDPTKEITVKVLGATLKDANEYALTAGTAVTATK